MFLRFILCLLLGSVAFATSSHPCTSFENCGSLYSRDYLQDVYYSGLRRVQAKAKSSYCKQKIEFEYMKHFRALAEESFYPFENVQYHSQCPNASTENPPLKPITTNVINLAQNDSIKLMAPPSGPLNASSLSILYIMLVHNHPEFATRIINSIDEPMHSFVIHVDANADEVQSYLQQQFANRTNIHFVEHKREVISWGGFSIVNATLTAMRLGWNKNIKFDYLMDISGTTYPLKSNNFIRKSFAENPNAVFMETYAAPVKPEASMWHQFVECDGALHRVARMPFLRGINMHVSSQWFAVPRHYVHWLLHSQLAADYIHYAQYIIIADENYFATMFFNSPYCKAEIKKTLVFLLFDKWEHERNTTETGKPRDLRKCLGVGPNNCGRSPTTLTMEFKNLIGSSRSLFARKFDPDSAASMALADYVDSMRGTYGNVSDSVVEKWDTNIDDTAASTMIRIGNYRYAPVEPGATNDTSSTETVGIQQSSSLMAASTSTSTTSSATGSELNTEAFNTKVEGITKSTDAVTQAAVPPALCLTYTTAAPNYIRATSCDPGNSHQWFEVGRCTHGYELELHDNACPTFRKSKPATAATATTVANSTANASVADSLDAAEIYCSIFTRSDKKELCIDIAGENPAFNTPLLGYDCTGRWNQLFKLTENCTIMAQQPGVIGRVRGQGDQNIVSCLDNSHSSGVLMTAACDHLTPVPVVLPVSVNGTDGTPAAATTVAVEVTGGVATGKTSTDSEVPSVAQKAVLGFTSRQQYQFMPATGTAFKEFMK